MGSNPTSDKTFFITTLCKYIVSLSQNNVRPMVRQSKTNSENLKLYLQIFFPLLSFFSVSGVKLNSQISASKGTSLSIQEISNGICTFSPTSRRGKLVFFIQTILLSFTPIMLLIVQNSLAFHEMIKWKNDIMHKGNDLFKALQNLFKYQMSLTSSSSCLN